MFYLKHSKQWCKLVGDFSCSHLTFSWLVIATARMRRFIFLPTSFCVRHLSYQQQAFLVKIPKCQTSRAPVFMG